MKKALHRMLILLIIFLVSSCNIGENEKIERQNISVAKKKSDDTITSEIKKTVFFNFGKWRIDSVAENKIVVNRLVDDSPLQVFNFRQDGVFSLMKITDRTTSDQVIGNWIQKKDSLLILNISGSIISRYSFVLTKSKLILNSRFEISSNNKKKPTFYLSKYKEKNYSNIFGHSK